MGAGGSVGSFPGQVGVGGVGDPIVLVGGVGVFVWLPATGVKVGIEGGVGVSTARTSVGSSRG